MKPVKLRFGTSQWIKTKPASIKSKDIEDGLKRLQKLADEYNRGLTVELGVSLSDGVKELVRLVERLRKGLDRKDREAQEALDEVAGSVEELRAEVESMVDDGGESEQAESEDAEEAGPRAMEAAVVKELVKKVARKPMAFAFGIDEDGLSTMAMHPTQRGTALLKLLKNNGVRNPTFGMASEQEGALRLDIEGKNLPNLARSVKKHLKDIGSTAYTKVTLFEGGVAVPDAPDPAGTEAMDVPRIPKNPFPNLPENPKPDIPLPDLPPMPKPETPKPDLPLPDLPPRPKPDAPKPDIPLPDLPPMPKPDAPKPDAPKPGPSGEPEDPPWVTPPLMVKLSVGRGGENKADDVEAVQRKLNEVAKIDLKPDGKCGPKTIGAITAFQKLHGFERADGRIDPGGWTERTINGEKLPPPGTAPAEPPKGGGKFEPKPPSGGGKGGGGAKPAPANPPANGRPADADDLSPAQRLERVADVTDGISRTRKDAEAKIGILEGLLADGKESARTLHQSAVRQLEGGRKLAERAGKHAALYHKQGSEREFTLAESSYNLCRKSYEKAGVTAQKGIDEATRSNGGRKMEET